MIQFGQNLRETRSKKGWNQEKLAAEMGVTQATISQLENGSRRPTPALARKFAEVLGIKLEELVGEEGPGVLEHQRLMRNLKGLSPKTLDTLNTIVEAMRQKELPKRQGKRPPQFAADFREALGLTPEQVVPDMIPLIEKGGYRYFEDVFADDFAAFTEWLGSEIYLIAYNSSKQYGSAFKRFSLAHELGHIAMHADILHSQRKLIATQGLSTRDPIELEANEFAAHFLMPSRIFSSKIDALDFSPESIRSLSQHFQVSEIAAAKHFVTHTNLACTMIVCDSKGMTKWENRSKKMSDLIKPAKYVFKTKIPGDSSTAEWIQGRGVEKKAIAPLTDWMPDLTSEMEAEEWVMKTPDSLYLTLLTPVIAELGSESK